MAKQELFERSPVRAFDEVANGGLKAGELGLVTAKKGLGKTSVLVQFGMDTLLNNKQLVHVSFDQHADNVISWYDGIFNEISKKKPLPNAADVKEQLNRNRIILNFNQDNFNLDKVVMTLNALKGANTPVAGVVIDGVDFAKIKENDIQTVASFAKAAKVKVWISATSNSEDLEDQAPKAILPYFTAVVHLAASKAHGTQVKILKMGKKGAVDSVLKLDPKTLLITNK
ncbi:MAG: hypothetical protein J6X11_05070 [Treponema sp.]|nr:hypothetical protein [Treponema sp.]